MFQWTVCSHFFSCLTFSTTTQSYSKPSSFHVYDLKHTPSNPQTATGLSDPVLLQIYKAKGKNVYLGSAQKNLSQKSLLKYLQQGKLKGESCSCATHTSLTIRKAFFFFFFSACSDQILNEKHTELFILSSTIKKSL